MIKNTVYYHARCPDGSAAAFAAMLKLGVDYTAYIAFSHQDEILNKDIEGRDVWFLDIAPTTSKDYIRVLEKSKHLVILDHHETTEKELGAFITVDQTQSGAMLAWKHFHPEKEVPRIYELIQDGDLYKFKYGHDTVHLSNVIASQGTPTLEKFSDLYHRDLEELLEEGRVLQVSIDIEIDKALKVVSRSAIGTPYVNVDRSILNRVLAKLYQDYPFSVGYQIEEKEGLVKFSLRSKNVEGINVADIAERFNGGGHRAAAGFVIPLEELKSLFPLETIEERIDKMIDCIDFFYVMDNKRGKKD